MRTLKCKALSVNEVWQGKRFKTPAYKDYEEEVMYLLPPLKIPESERLRVDYVFGLSSKNADYDNCIKPFQDILQKKYGFNDTRIYYATIRKVNVKNGDEFISFEINELG